LPSRPSPKKPPGKAAVDPNHVQIPEAFAGPSHADDPYDEWQLTRGKSKHWFIDPKFPKAPSHWVPQSWRWDSISGRNSQTAPPEHEHPHVNFGPNSGKSFKSGKSSAKSGSAKSGSIASMGSSGYNVMGGEASMNANV